MDQYTDEAIYLIKPDGYPTPFKVKCSGGGGGGGHFNVKPRVTHIQRNSFACCPSTSFNQSWAAYREGFGDRDKFSCSYWLGNEKLAAMTAQKSYKLTIYVSKRHWTKKKAFYTNFSVANQSSNFKMQYSSFENAGFFNFLELDDGFTAANALNQNLKGAQFYTYDYDNVGKCAATLGSGWWFDTDCARVNLNTDHDPQWYIGGTLKTFQHAYMYLE
ncbi:fibrinogen-like protein 1 [Gigantopelta aegis]|uniref:fibrinogen-like protein 1 n=1 Tax=Gigantopelta aegis TaxID=1735272 RepID=UPI001B88C5C4|nr:fibrinogen-like protein 1 [Gigantopelta aegis]